MDGGSARDLRPEADLGHEVAQLTGLVPPSTALMLEPALRRRVLDGLSGTGRRSVTVAIDRIVYRQETSGPWNASSSGSMTCCDAVQRRRGVQSSIRAVGGALERALHTTTAQPSSMTCCPDPEPPSKIRRQPVIEHQGCGRWNEAGELRGLVAQVRLGAQVTRRATVHRPATRSLEPALEGHPRARSRPTRPRERSRPPRTARGPPAAGRAML